MKRFFEEHTAVIIICVVVSLLLCIIGCINNINEDGAVAGKGLLKIAGDNLTDTIDTYQGKLIPNDNLLDKNLKYKQPSFSSKEITGKFWGNNVLVSSEIHKILKPNTQYTISYNYEITDLSDKAFPDFNIRIGFVLWEKDDIQNRNRYLFATNFKTKNVKKYYSKTFTTPSEIPSTYELLVYSNRYDAENGDYDMDTVRISNIKLEEGSKATLYVE